MKKFNLLTNVNMYREFPAYDLVVVGKFQINFYVIKEKLEWEILDFIEFESIHFANTDITDYDKKVQTIEYMKNVFDVDVIRELEIDIADVVSDVGVEEFMTMETGLSFI